MRRKTENLTNFYSVRIFCFWKQVTECNWTTIISIMWNSDKYFCVCIFPACRNWRDWEMTTFLILYRHPWINIINWWTTRQRQNCQVEQQWDDSHLSQHFSDKFDLWLWPVHDCSYSSHVHEIFARCLYSRERCLPFDQIFIWPFQEDLILVQTKRPKNCLKFSHFDNNLWIQLAHCAILVGGK